MMYDLSMISHTMHCVINSFMMLSSFLLLMLIVYKISYHRSKWSIGLDGILFILTFICLLLTLTYCRKPEEIAWLGQLPAYVPICTIVVVWVYGIFAFLWQLHLRLNELSANSIREAVDTLDMGLAFCDEYGRLVLSNQMMNELYWMVNGSYPQKMREIERLFEQTELYDEEVCMFPNHTVWRFVKVPMEGEFEGWSQLNAIQVTEWYEKTKQLAKENEKLTETNYQLEKMYDQVADRIREQEALALKMRIHDDIGTSLLAIRNLIVQEASGEALSEQLSILQMATGDLSYRNEPSVDDTFEDLQQEASSLSIQIVCDALLPSAQPAKGLLLAALRECITNTARHAKGTRVYVHIEEEDDIVKVSITNNGALPKLLIEEGVGLSSLRKRVERAKGKMEISTRPIYELRLELPKREEAL